jgi:hypothetical protein
MCLDQTYSTVRTGKYLYDTFPPQNGLEKGDDLPPLLASVTLKYAIRKTRWD